MSSSSRCALHGLVVSTALALAGCAQVDGTGLSNPTGDGPTSPIDLAKADVPHSDGLDLTVGGVDMASSDLASGIQVCVVGKIKINEVATQGAGGAGDEFVELYNPCGGQVAMSGASLVYRSAMGTADTPALWAFTNEVIPSKGFFVVANTGFAGTANAKPFQYGSSGAFSSTGGGLGLRDSGGTLVDSVGWGTASDAFVEGTPVGAPSASQSAARTADGVDTNNNLADFSLGARTPGATN